MNRLDAVLEDLALLEDRQDRIDYLIGLAQEYQHPTDEEVPRSAETRVPGCESEVYITSDAFEKGKKFKIAVDNPQGVSAMALAVILDGSLSGQPPEVVQSVPDDIVYKIFGNELSMGKSMGLNGMVRMVKEAALRG